MQINIFGWQNQVSATAAAISALAGVATLESFYWENVAKGSALSEQPDFGLTTGTLFASLSAYGDDQRRYEADDTMRKLGFTSIKLLNMAVIADPSLLAGRFYLLNTNGLELQVLRTPQMQNIGDAPDTIPISVGEFRDDVDTLNSYALMHVTFNLVASSLQRQGVMTSVT